MGGWGAGPLYESDPADEVDSRAEAGAFPFFPLEMPLSIDSCTANGLWVEGPGMGFAWSDSVATLRGSCTADACFRAPLTLVSRGCQVSSSRSSNSPLSQVIDRRMCVDKKSQNCSKVEDVFLPFHHHQRTMAR
jgi:hypothetical protein